MNNYEYNLQVGLTYNNYAKKISYNKGIKTLNKILSKYVSGYTITKCIGYWQGKKEKSININIINENKIDFIINQSISEICTILNQDCVMLKKSIVNVNFLSKNCNE